MTEDVEFDLLPREVREFRPRCPGCDPMSIQVAGARPCSYYDCPGLPSKLQVTCDLCMFDFASGDGQVKCDHESCETAIRLRSNVPIYRAWLAHLLTERQARRSRHAS